MCPREKYRQKIRTSACREGHLRKLMYTPPASSARLSTAPSATGRIADRSRHLLRTRQVAIHLLEDGRDCRRVRCWPLQSDRFSEAAADVAAESGVCCKGLLHRTRARIFAVVAVLH